MNIAIFTNNYLPNPYGVTRSIESFRAEFEKNGHTVFIFAPRWKDYMDTNDNVYRYPSIDINVKFRFPLAVPHSQEIDHIIKDLDIDIVHAQHPNLLGLTARRWARKKKVPLVFTWHTLYNYYVHFVPFIPSKVAVSYVTRNARRYANKADHVVVPTPSIIPMIKKWGVTNPHITAIQTGVSPMLFADADREKMRTKLQYAPGDIVLITNMRLSEEKNAVFLIDAVARLLVQHENMYFIIIGSGDQKDLLVENLRKDNVLWKVRFAGEVSQKDVGRYLTASDIFVYASESETQGMVITEAMCAGLPIVAVNATGVRDQVKVHQTGFLVVKEKHAFVRAVEKLSDDPVKRKGFGERAKKIAWKKYTVAVSAQQMIDLYHQTIKKYNKKKKYS